MKINLNSTHQRHELALVAERLPSHTIVVQATVAPTNERNNP